MRRFFILMMLCIAQIAVAQPAEGQGPAEFIRTIRIKRGRALLETSQMQVTEIAYAVGFTTVKSFTMNFKAEYGMTPSEYKQKT